MRVTATVSVRPDEGDRPDRKKLEEAAKLLEQSGFDIVRIGRFGISVKGEAADFARVLGVEAAPNKAMAMRAKPSQPELSKIIDQVEVASDPQLY